MWVLEDQISPKLSEDCIDKAIRLRLRGFYRALTCCPWLLQGWLEEVDSWWSFRIFRAYFLLCDRCANFTYGMNLIYASEDRLYARTSVRRYVCPVKRVARKKG